MAFTRVNPGDPIQSHQLDQVIDALSGAAAAGQPIALTALNDATNYALTVQNDEATNSRALNVLKSDGTTLIKADVTGVTLGSPLTLPTGSITGTEIANGTIGNVDLGPDVQRASLLVNGGFEQWQRGSGPYTANNAFTADRWGIGLAGTDTLSVQKTTAAANIDNASTAAAACTFTLGTGAGSTNIGQQIKFVDGYQIRNAQLSVSVRVNTTTANAVQIGIYNNSTWTYSAFHPGSGGYQTLTATATLGSSSTLVAQVGIFFAASCTAYVDNAMLVVGSQPANYVPLPPADDLARCKRYYEIVGTSGGGDVLVGGIASAASQNAWTTLVITEKAVTPTATLLGTWSSTNCGAPSLTSPSIRAFRLQCVSSSAGLFYSFNSNAGNYITLESNP